MQHDELIKLLMGTFLEELEEQAQALDRDLLAFERDPAGPNKEALLRTLFRTVHSIKGASRVVDIDMIGTVCHDMEELLQLAQAGAVPASWFQLMLAASEAIRDAGQRLRRGEGLEASPLAALVPRLEEAVYRGVPEAAAAEPAAPAAAVAEAEPGAEAAAAAVAAAATEPAAAAEPVADTARASDAASVRVPAEKLDTLLVRVGELVLASTRSGQLLDELDDLQEDCRSALTDRRGTGGAKSAVASPRDILRRVERKLEHLASRAAASQRGLEQAVKAAEDDVHRLRLLPFGVVCRGHERTVRDLAHAGGKQAELIVQGGDLAIDRSVLDALRDPLLHLVRNAVEHGVERPEVRRAAGKPERARVTVSAALLGSQVEVVVSDDGRGLDLEAIRHQARRRGLRIPTEERELAQLIFQPGFSTAKLVTTGSGRGVGLDVVKSQVEASHGTLQLDWDEHGTRFVINVPLTVTTIRALLVTVAGQLYAVPVAGIRSLRRVTHAEVQTVEGWQTVTHEGRPVAILPLAQVLGLSETAAQARAERKVPGLLLAAEGKEVVVLVDELVSEQDVVVKNLGRRIKRLKHLSGATLLATGRIAFVLHIPDVVRTALARMATPAFAKTQAEVRTRILIAEDSLTTRTLEKTILEAAGYEVLVAADGAEAWELLNAHGADLVVSDVEMPRMDGLTLAATIRASKRFRSLPVVLMTSLDQPEHKQRGADAGADAYIVKSAFDQTSLLDIIRQLT